MNLIVMENPLLTKTKRKAGFRAVASCALALALGATAVRAQVVSVSPAPPAPRWTAEHANEWYAKQAWLVGANYVPSDAINQFEMFQAATWNPALNDRELGF